MLDGERTAGRQKTNFPSKNSCGKPYKTKSHLTKFLANHLEKSKSFSYIIVLLPFSL